MLSKCQKAREDSAKCYFSFHIQITPGKLFAQNKVRPFRCNKAPTTCKKACTHKKLKRSPVRLISLKLTCFYLYIFVQLCVGITNYCKGFLQNINLMEPMSKGKASYIYVCMHMVSRAGERRLNFQLQEHSKHKVVR
jgi:hypothetical protein